MDKIRRSLIKNALATVSEVSGRDIEFLAEDTGSNEEFVMEVIESLK
jgi:hypothetical protein